MLFLWFVHWVSLCIHSMIIAENTDKGTYKELFFDTVMIASAGAAGLCLVDLFNIP